MRKRILRALTLILFPLIGATLIRLLYLTLRTEFHFTRDDAPQSPIVVAFWHGDLLMQPFLYRGLRKDPRIRLMISEHFDGLLLSKTMAYFSYGTIQGSSTRGGAKVLIQAMKSLKEGYDVGLTPDGPKGPRHEVQNGIVVMAQKTGAKVVVLYSVPQRYWQLRSWDRFTIPKPFSKIDFYISEPIDLSGMDLQSAKMVMKDALMRHQIEDLGADG